MVVNKQGKPKSRLFSLLSKNEENGTIIAKCGFCGGLIVTTQERLDNNEVWHYCKERDT